MIFEKRKFVRGESIPVKVCLENLCSKAILLDELSPLASSLYFRILGKKGFKGSFSLLSWLDREGIILHPPEERTFTIPPNGKKVLDLDLLKIFGELPEDLYKIRATYTSHGILFIESDIVQIKIEPSNPIYISSTRDYLRCVYDPTYSVWINRKSGEHFLYFMVNSPNFPQNIWQNRLITRLEKPCEAHVAIPENYDQARNCIVWSENSRLYTCVVGDEGFSLKSFELPFKIEQILEPPYFSEEQRLTMLAYTSRGGSPAIYLVKVTEEGRVLVETLETLESLLEEYSLVFEEEAHAHLVYTSNRGFECNHVELSGVNFEDRVKRRLLKGVRCFGLELSNNCLDERGESFLALHYLTLEDGRFNAHIMDVMKKAEIVNFFIPFEKELELKCIDVILDENCLPHHLFQDRNGILWYQPSEGGMIKASEEGEYCPRNIQFPKLILSSELSRHHGIFVRYVKDKKYFVYRKLEDL